MRHLKAALLVTVVLAGCGDDSTLRADASFDAGTDAGGPAERVPLDPRAIAQFVEPLVIPPAMPPSSTSASLTEYRIAARQFEQQVLPAPLPKTTVWGYGKDGDPSTFHSPSFTIENRTDHRVRVQWINGLIDDDGRYLPHLLPLDSSLYWANPPGPIDSHGHAGYRGPVPIVTHVHGGHVSDHSDGGPEAWYLPDANDIPAGLTTRGSRYASVVDVGAGAAVFEYPNSQRAGSLWFHDHALGITRLNVYAGLAGFWLVRDDAEDALELPGPAPRVGDAANTRYYEIPLAIQDRSFFDDGSLRYPVSRAEFDGYEGPYAPKTEVPPIWNPEFFGDAIIVNGHTWPYQEVEPRLYRFRLLNGCNSRFLVLRFEGSDLSFHQIGNDAGLLSGAPVVLDELLMGPGERRDVIVDFSSLKPGDRVMLVNAGPDEPYKGPRETLAPANPKTTGRIMELRVVAKTTQGNAGVMPDSLPKVKALTTTLAARDLTLHEEVFETVDGEIPVEAKLGTAHDGPLDWDDPITEEPRLGSTEIWRIANLTADAHPIHLHLVTFQVVDRRAMDAEAYAEAQREWLEGGRDGAEPRIDDFLSGNAMPAPPEESGFKDTVVANPGEVTRVIANFDLAGTYLWHCHILEHEDNEMMRPFRVVEAP